jgi:hypothetical protein
MSQKPPTHKLRWPGSTLCGLSTTLGSHGCGYAGTVTNVDAEV